MSYGLEGGNPNPYETAARAIGKIGVNGANALKLMSRDQAAAVVGNNPALVAPAFGEMMQKGRIAEMKTGRLARSIEIPPLRTLISTLDEDMARKLTDRLPPDLIARVLGVDSETVAPGGKEVVQEGQTEGKGTEQQEPVSKPDGLADRLSTKKIDKAFKWMTPEQQVAYIKERLHDNRPDAAAHLLRLPPDRLFERAAVRNRERAVRAVERRVEQAKEKGPSDYIMGDRLTSLREKVARARLQLAKWADDFITPDKVQERGNVLREVTKHDPETAAKIVEAMKNWEQAARAVSAMNDPEQAAQLITSMGENGAHVIRYMRSQETVDTAKHMLENAARTLHEALDHLDSASAPALKSLKEGMDIRAQQNKQNMRINALIERGNPYELIHIIREGDANPLAREMSVGQAAVLLLKVDARSGAHVLEGIESSRAAEFLTEIAKQDPQHAAFIVEALTVDEKENRKIASQIVGRMEWEMAAAMLDVMGAQAGAEIIEPLFNKVADKAIGITRLMDPERAADMIEKLPPKLQADMIAGIVDTGAGTWQKWKVRTLTSASILACAVIGQTQLIEQQGGITANVLSTISTALVGVGLISNWFYGKQQSWIIPKPVPFIGGRTLGSTANLHSLSTTAAWGALGTAMQYGFTPFMQHGFIPFMHNIWQSMTHFFH